ncbi:asr4942 [Nostoc sp. PCC 7120 = FACHB-418]|nr:asr4942 [Nostoc sp. PCC 7120 = FACHB-418]
MVEATASPVWIPKAWEKRVEAESEVNVMIAPQSMGLYTLRISGRLASLWVACPLASMLHYFLTIGK